MRLIYAVQFFNTNDVWQTVYISSFYSDAAKTYRAAEQVQGAPIRLVEFTVSDFDFLGTYCRNFQVITRRD